MNKSLSKISLGIGTLALILLNSPISAKAADPIITLASPPQADNTTTLGSLINGVGGTVLKYLTLVAGLLAVIYLIWSGIQYITSQGDAAKATKARSGIINAIIGVIIIFAAYYIIFVALGIGNTVTNTINGGPNGEQVTN